MIYDGKGNREFSQNIISSNLMLHGSTVKDLLFLKNEIEIYIIFFTSLSIFSE